MINSTNHCRFLKVILASLIFLIIILGVINCSLNGDEDFTVGLIHNTYGNIISLDSLDVHPPLYYFLLKLFLQITTFWTNDIFIKVVFARIFSFIVLISFMSIGLRLFKLIGIKCSWEFICIIFISVPGVLLYSQYIRMYILASTFLLMELFEIIKYIKYNKNIFLVASIICGSLASYTHYFAAISAGLLLLYLFFRYIYYKNYKQAIKISLSGIIFLILYVPWMFCARTQFKMATSNQYNTNQIYTQSSHTIKNFIQLIKQSILSVVGGKIPYNRNITKIISLLLLLLFVYLIFWSIKNLSSRFNILLFVSISTLLGTIFVGVVVSIIKHPILIDHYLFASFSIFAFLMSYVIYQYIRKYNINKSHKCLSYILIFILFLNVSLYIRHDTINLIKAHSIVTKMNMWHKYKCSYVYIVNNKKNIWNIANDSIYLNSIHKDIRTNNFKNTNIMFGRSDVKLMHGVYPNVKK